MRRQKKFYAWGYADEDLTPDEIGPWEAEIAQRYGLNGFDVTPPPKAEEITLRAPRVAVPPALQSIVRTDHLTRLEHSYGKAGFDTLRMFMRSVPNPPDAVAFPENEQDIVRVLDWCDQIGAKAIPYGGGSSVVKGIEPPASAEKVVTISTRHMDKVLEVDAVSQAARIQGGIYGPAIEDQLRASPFTMRHYMQAYRCSTLGGWIATRSGGHYATLYTHIDDFVESMRVVTPAGTLETRRLPGSGAGPSPDRMFLGSEGILGHHHRGLGAAAQEADLPRLGLGALQDFLRRRRRGARHHPGRPLSRQLPAAGSARGAARHPVEQRGGGAGAGLRRRRPPARRLDGAGARNLPRPWRRGRPGGRRRERASLGRRRRLAQQVHPRAALRRARGGPRHPLLDLRDLDDLGARPRLPRQDHARSPATRSSA